MGHSESVKIRNLLISDLPELHSFFLKAYGPETVFQDQTFLRWYFFNSSVVSKPEAAGSIICLVAGQIVSFYGAVNSCICFNNTKLDISWGVNAFVLPGHRGQSLNSRSLEIANKQSTLHGVIGFTSTAAGFYKNQGYNLFYGERFDRYVRVISEPKTNAVISFLCPERVPEFGLLVHAFSGISLPQSSRILQVTDKNIAQLEINFGVQITLTTWRDKAYLLQRFLRNPFIDYRVFAVVSGKNITCFCACRDEVLQPLGITVTRVIDLFGKPEDMPGLLNFIVARAQKNNHAYVDFSAFGNLYQQQFLEAGFTKLSGDDYSLLPQVSAPVEQRPNMEFVGLFSILPELDIRSLSPDDVYFTRADSDRDRIARLHQLKQTKGKDDAE